MFQIVLLRIDCKNEKNNIRYENALNNVTINDKQCNQQVVNIMLKAE